MLAMTSGLRTLPWKLSRGYGMSLNTLLYILFLPSALQMVYLPPAICGIPSAIADRTRRFSPIEAYVLSRCLGVVPWWYCAEVQMPQCGNLRTLARLCNACEAHSCGPKAQTCCAVTLAPLPPDIRVIVRQNRQWLQVFAYLWRSVLSLNDFALGLYPQCGKHGGYRRRVLLMIEQWEARCNQVLQVRLDPLTGEEEALRVSIVTDITDRSAFASGLDTDWSYDDDNE